MHLQPVTDSLWEVVRTVNVKGALRIGHRMTVLRIGDGVVVHSPVEFEPALADAVAEIGPVRWIMAPNLKHDLFLQEWIARFPEADLLAPPGMTQLHPSLPLRSLAEASLPVELELHHIAGMPQVDEYVLLHRPSRTLIIADLFFNLHRLGDRWSRFVMWANGAWRRPAPSRLFRLFVKDKVALRASIDRLLELDFDRIVVGHGDNIQSAGRAVLQRAYDWL